MNKIQYLYIFRRSRTQETLEKMFERLLEKAPADEHHSINLAADHRRAELACNQMWDKVPRTAWQFVK